MAIMPGADWIGPTPNKYPGGQTERRGLVLHIEEGSDSGSISWFKNPEAQASAHFLNPKTGNIHQLVDTDDAAWAEVSGNRHWISVEHEGFSGDSLTPSQLENDAQLLAWLHTEYSVPLESTDDPDGEGLGWHGMGGDAWGGHFDCPGDPIKAQRGAIIARAQEILGGGSQGSSTPVSVPSEPSFPAWPNEYLRLTSSMLHDNNVYVWQHQMASRGWHISQDGWYGPQSANVCRQFQQECVNEGYDVGGVDGIVGPKTWKLSFTKPIT